MACKLHCYLRLLNVLVILPKKGCIGTKIGFCRRKKQMLQLKIFKPVAILGLMAAFASPGVYAGYDWSFTSGNCISGGCSNNGATYGNQWGFDGANGHDDVTVSAWSNTGSGGSLQTGKIKVWTGLGVENRSDPSGAPNHAVDNGGTDGYYDSVLFDFGSDSIALNKIRLGWVGRWDNDPTPVLNNTKDSDLTVLAYTGSGTPSLGGNKYSDLISNGWEHVGDYSNIHDETNMEKTINTTNVSSSYWLIGAFNPIFSGKSWTNDNDYFKIYKLSGETTSSGCSGGGCCSGGGSSGCGGGSVPEPSSLLLLGFALPLLRRRTRS